MWSPENAHIHFELWCWSAHTLDCRAYAHSFVLTSIMWLSCGTCPLWSLGITLSWVTRFWLGIYQGSHKAWVGSCQQCCPGTHPCAFPGWWSHTSSLFSGRSGVTAYLLCLDTYGQRSLSLAAPEVTGSRGPCILHVMMGTRDLEKA